MQHATCCGVGVKEGSGEMPGRVHAAQCMDGVQATGAHAQLDVRLGEGQFATHRHLDLLLDEVHSCDHLRHGMLHLQRIQRSMHGAHA
jgi:hypothetical protein